MDASEETALAGLRGSDSELEIDIVERDYAKSDNTRSVALLR